MWNKNIIYVKSKFTLLVHKFNPLNVKQNRGNIFGKVNNDIFFIKYTICYIIIHLNP